MITLLGISYGKGASLGCTHWNALRLILYRLILETLVWFVISTVKPDICDPTLHSDDDLLEKACSSDLGKTC